MTQPFADALTWMPKSRALGVTLTRAHDLARAMGHPAVSLEHLLQALVEDPDASAVLLNCNIDLLKLNRDVSAQLQGRPGDEVDQPEASQGLLLILEYAAAAARQSKRPDVSGAIVLAAMVGEGKSDAAKLLLSAGLKFEDAIAALRRGAQVRVAADAPAAQVPGVQAAPPPLPPMPAPAAPAPPTAARSQPVAAASHVVADEDPITTARRRVAALRAGQDPSLQSGPFAAAPSNRQGVPSDTAANSMAATASGSSGQVTWAPMPQAPAPMSTARPTRMPPPVPPIPDRPPPTNGNPTQNGLSGPAGVQRSVPWTDPAIEYNAAVSPVPAHSVPALGDPIDPVLLGDSVPFRMQERVPSIVEIKISRTALLATTAALSGNSFDKRDTVVTRAISVRLKAPNGGLHVEMASPETQWFDNRGSIRADDEARWRWVVTPHSSTGARQLQLSVVIRTVAADGTILETALPEHRCSVKVGSNFREGFRRIGRALIAVSAGVVIAMLANGGFAAVFGGLFR